MYGSKNKLMRHRASGIPVDLFSATTANWFNYLVCRTGRPDKALGFGHLFALRVQDACK